MVRIIGFFVGLGFCLVLAIAFFTGAYNQITNPPAATVEEEFHLHPKHLELASNGPFGRFDRQQLQRGFQVYKEVCSACHSLKYVAFRDLKDLSIRSAGRRGCCSPK